MNDQSVSLKIVADESTSLLINSDIRIFSDDASQVRQFRQTDFTAEADFFLGVLDSLKETYLVVDTFVRKKDSNSKKSTARITYEISYGDITVEKVSIESHFLDRGVAILGFRFRFCPRFPFC